MSHSGAESEVISVLEAFPNSVAEGSRRPLPALKNTCRCFPKKKKTARTLRHDRDGHDPDVVRVLGTKKRKSSQETFLKNLEVPR